MRKHGTRVLRDFPADSSKKHLALSQAQFDKPMLLPVNCIKYKTFTSIVRYGNPDIFLDEIWYGPDKIATVERFDPYVIVVEFLRPAAYWPVGGRVSAINNLLSGLYTPNEHSPGMSHIYKGLRVARKRGMPDHNPVKFLLSRNGTEVINYGNTIVEGVRGYFATENSKHGSFVKLRMYRSSQMSTTRYATQLRYARTHSDSKWRSAKGAESLKVVIAYEPYRDVNYDGGVIAVIADDVEFDLKKLKLKRRLIVKDVPPGPAAFCSPASRDYVIQYINSLPFPEGTVVRPNEDDY